MDEFIKKEENNTKKKLNYNIFNNKITPSSLTEFGEVRYVLGPTERLVCLYPSIC